MALGGALTLAQTAPGIAPLRTAPIEKFTVNPGFRDWARDGAGRDHDHRRELVESRRPLRRRCRRRHTEMDLPPDRHGERQSLRRDGARRVGRPGDRTDGQHARGGDDRHGPRSVAWTGDGAVGGRCSRWRPGLRSRRRRELPRARRRDRTREMGGAVSRQGIVRLRADGTGRHRLRLAQRRREGWRRQSSRGVLPAPGGARREHRAGTLAVSGLAGRHCRHVRRTKPSCRATPTSRSAIRSSTPSISRPAGTSGRRSRCVRRSMAASVRSGSRDWSMRGRCWWV